MLFAANVTAALNANVVSVVLSFVAPKSRILIVSLTEDQAKLIVQMILTISENLHKQLIAKGTKKPTQTKITYKNGSSAIARPVGQTGDAVRGFTGDVLIVDEASRMNELVWIGAKPTLMTTGGQLWFCSTPHGKQGYFYECFLNKNNRFKVWHKSSPEVIEERPISSSWTKKQREEALKFLDEEQRDMSQKQFGQEYGGLFLEDLTQFFPDELIAKACVLERFQDYNNRSYMGVDIARMGDDRTVYSIFTAINDKFYMTFNNIVSKQYTTQTYQDIVRLIKTFKVDRCGIDAGSGSLGVSIFDRLMNTPGLKRKIVAMNNRQIALDRHGEKQQRIMKEDFYDNLLSMMEKGTIKMLDHESIYNSLKSVQIEVSQEGRYTKVRLFSTPHNASDVVEAIVRAAWLAEKEKILKFAIHYI